MCDVDTAIRSGCGIEWFGRKRPKRDPVDTCRSCRSIGHASCLDTGRADSSVSVPPSPEERSLLLLVKPAKEFPKPRIGPDLLDRVERVAQFVVRPRLVDEVLTRMAGRRDVSSTFAARHNVVPSRGHLPVTECANFVHTVGPIFLQKHIHSCA